MALAAMKPEISADAETKRRIAAFLQDFSIEATRPVASEIAELKAIVPTGTRICLSAIPNHPQGDLADQAAAVRAAGLEPVPHLAARNFASRQALADLLAQLQDKAQVRTVLIIAGDRDDAAGPFTSAIEIIDSGLLHQYGIAEIGVAGHPDGHPRISPEALDKALAAKLDAASESGLKAHVATQFSFDADAIQHWIVRLRDLGVEHPVRIGMAGPTALTRLLRYAARCGVRATASGMARQSGLVKHLFGVAAPDGIVRPLAEAAANGRLGRVAAHFFSFGGVGASARWVMAAAQGRIVLDHDGFSVEAPA
jgi:methylenetetrahydrofolate reductase (NADPH)